ncbi:hypothetical protein [Ktedonobacter racemifer]|uniref:Uncharacterized protein n=1 Tax=Ktedonobacter racemifer DSM 44963 TaxID=485913 RepID=D6TH55_KTERA|nr:hypothetical protein [Ktedonobacter racemifer]EFH90797.1 hypothetical protein Krac_12436 [Ktedonobacter racemifer DSM 44963]
MADSTAPNATNAKYSFSTSTISAEDYKAVQAEREEFAKKQLAANNEFMFQHYARILRALDISWERVTKANVILERKTRREEAKKRRETLRVRK